MRWIPLLLLLLVTPAHAGSVNVSTAAALQGAWYDEEAYPSDFELGGTVAASFQPRLSAVGGAFYGVSQTYIRGCAGVRYCVSDVDDQDFSTHLGVQYNVSSNESLRPQEWTGDLSVGWRPRPVDLPAVILVGQGTFGFESHKASAYVGARLLIGGTR